MNWSVREKKCIQNLVRNSAGKGLTGRNKRRDERVTMKVIIKKLELEGGFGNKSDSW
jgi:hypothetical protein